MVNKVKILMAEFVTHDVKRFVLEKPENYEFIPGQATEISINKEEWKDKKRPFTFTSLNSDKILEFIIKKYPEHEGVTQQLHKLNPGDELIIGEPFGTINYKGKGNFIAGGAGITPFIAILRKLKEEGRIEGNKLIFSNKKKKDVILEKEFKEMFNQDGLIFTLTREKGEGYKSERIDKEFLKKHIDNFNQNFYICGPPKMVEDLRKTLKDLGAGVEGLLFEGKEE